MQFHIKKNNSLGDIINSYRCVKQGDGLSPLLFNSFVNDLNHIFTTDCDPIMIDNTTVYSLQYADDLVLMSTTESGLHRCLGKLELFCKKVDAGSSYR